DGEAVDQLEHQSTTPDNDGYAHQQAKDDQAHLMGGVGALCGAGDRNNVIQAHNEVGNDDGLDRRHQCGTALDAIVGIFIRQEQLDADPEQQHATDDLHEGYGQECNSKENQDD